MWQLWFSVLYTGWYVVLLNYVCKPKLNCNHWDPCAVGCYNVYFQFSSVTQSYLFVTPYLGSHRVGHNWHDLAAAAAAAVCSMLGLPVHHQLPEFMQTHVHWVSDAIQPSQSLSSPFPPVLNFSQHEGLFKWVSSSYQVAKLLEFQLQHQSFQWTLRTDLL